MEILFEFLFLVPELFFDMLGIHGFTTNGRKKRKFSGEESGTIYLIARRMENMSPEGRRRMVRFNGVTFLLIALGTFAIGILTIGLMSSISGWFWIPGVAVEILMAVLAYGCWKRKALEMTAGA